MSERLPEADDATSASATVRRAGCSPTSCSTSTARTRVRAERAAARRARASGACTTCAPTGCSSLSEDLPVVSIAVDTRERIEGLLQRGPGDQAPRADHARACAPARRRPSGRARAGGARRGRGEADRLRRPPRADRRASRAFAAICALLHRARHGRRDRPARRRRHARRRGASGRASSARNADVPLMIDRRRLGRARSRRCCPSSPALLEDPLMTLERVRVCKRDGELLRAPHELAQRDAPGQAPWQKLTVYSSQRRDARRSSAAPGDRPPPARLGRRRRDRACAGVWGFHGEHAPHGDRLLQLRRHVPVVTVAIDTPAAHRALVCDRRRADRRARARDQRAGPGDARAERGRARRLAAPARGLRVTRGDSRTENACAACGADPAGAGLDSLAGSGTEGTAQRRLQARPPNQLSFSTTGDRRMTLQRLSTWLTLSLAATALIAGCGSSSSGSSSTSGRSTATTASTSAATNSTASTPTTSTGTQTADQAYPDQKRDPQTRRTLVQEPDPGRPRADEQREGEDRNVVQQGRRPPGRRQRRRSEDLHGTHQALGSAGQS